MIRLTITPSHDIIISNFYLFSGGTALKKHKGAACLIFLAAVLAILIFMPYLWAFLLKKFMTVTEDNYFFATVLVTLPELVIFTGILALRKRLTVLTRNGRGIINTLLAGGFMLTFSIILLMANVMGLSPDRKPLPAMQILWFLLSMILSAGLREELVFRGIMQNTLREYFGWGTKKGVYLSVFISGAVFGLTHLVNIQSGVTVAGAVSQAIGAAGMGFYMGAIYARGGSLWALVILHSFEDIAALAGSGIFGVSTITQAISNGAGIPSRLVTFALYTALTLFLLRNDKLQECYDAFDIRKKKQQSP